MKKGISKDFYVLEDLSMEEASSIVDKLYPDLPKSD